MSDAEGHASHSYIGLAVPVALYAWIRRRQWFPAAASLAIIGGVLSMLVTTGDIRRMTGYAFPAIFACGIAAMAPPKGVRRRGVLSGVLLAALA